MNKKCTLFFCSALLFQSVTFGQWIAHDSTLTSTGVYADIQWPSTATINVPAGVTVNANSANGGGNLIVNGTLHLSSGGLQIDDNSKALTIGAGAIVTSKGLSISGSMNIDGTIDLGSGDGHVQKKLIVGASSSITTTGTFYTNGEVVLGENAALDFGAFSPSLTAGQQIIIQNGSILTIQRNSSINAGSLIINEGGTVDAKADLNFSNSNNVINGSLTVGGTLTFNSSPNTMACPGKIITETLMNQSGSAPLSGNGYIEVHQSFTGANPLTGSAGITLNTAGASVNTGNPGSATIGTESPCAATLPVGLKDFSGAYAAGIVTLKWTTVSEINNNRFVIERASDGVKFAEIARIASQSAGKQSSIALRYTYQDPLPLAGKNYYRLKQIDNNGQVHYFDKTVSVSSNSNSSIRIYPNPVHTTLYIKGAAGENAVYIIVDATGRTVKRSTTASIDVTGLSNGIYFVQMLNDNNSKLTPIGKFIKR